MINDDITMMPILDFQVCQIGQINSPLEMASWRGCMTSFHAVVKNINLGFYLPPDFGIYVSKDFYYVYPQLVLKDL